MRLYYSDLTEKGVVLISGEQVGVVADLVFNTERGTMESILVKPNRNIEIKDLKQDKAGLYIVSMRSIASVKDYIVVDPRRK
ncbi:MAG: PRC-barrel domain-containing protein [Candidatus Thermoplasmatota archaeon]|nr:PRC-barrel domain-containing protein [Candidatus Thermoplasmatota archaeon]